MKLTALEIKQQTFEKSIRGYDPAEVQAFLNLVSNEWEHLTAKIRELETQIDKLNDKLEHYEKVEQALHETLQTAKDSADQKMTGARKESKNIIEKAEMEADAIIQEANQHRQQVRQSILRLLDRRKEIIGGIRSYLELAQESLEQFAKDEATQFQLPKEEELDKKIENRLKNPSSEAENTENKSKKEDTPLPPGAEDMDDILDEIE